MVGPPNRQTLLASLLGDPQLFDITYHTTTDGKVLIQLINGNQTQVFVGTSEDAGRFIDALQNACARADAVDTALRGN